MFLPTSPPSIVRLSKNSIWKPSSEIPNFVSVVYNFPCFPSLCTHSCPFHPLCSGHDLLFDSGLQFRPTSSRRKRELADNYWNAITRELDTGCTCSTVDAHQRLRERVCVCSKTPVPFDKPIRVPVPPGNAVTYRTPSRLTPLLSELLEVLISIIQPVVTRSPNLAVHPGLLHPQYSQNSTHVARLRSILDADLIQQTIAHKLFDPSGVFQEIGDVIRCYCAPMRDHAVDQMVKLAQSCAPGGTGTKADAVKAIRHCFEIMELMKLVRINRLSL